MAASIALTLAASFSATVAADTDMKLVLSDALGEGRDVELFIAWRGGQAVATFSQARKFNGMPHKVVARDVTFAGGKLVGTFAITIPFDGWVPKSGKALELTAAVEAAASADGKTLAGTYKLTGDEALGGKLTGARELAAVLERPAGGGRNGKLTGAASAPADAKAVQRLTLHCENAMVFEGKAKPGHARVGMTLSLKDARSFAARVLPRGSMTDTSATICVARHELKLDGPRLTGRLEAVVRGQGKSDEPVTFMFDLDGMVIAGAVSGSMKITRAGKAMDEPGLYTGTVAFGAADPAEALCRLSLLGAIEPYNNFDLYVTVRDGRVFGGFATSPNYNNAIHTVNLEGLKVEAGRLAGKMGITLQPDGWIPKDRKPIPCSYELDAKIADGEIVSGTVVGKFGGKDVKGTVEGNLDRKPDLRSMSGLTLKYEGGAFGRAFLTMQYADGKFVSGKVWNNHTDLTGTVDKADLDFSGERVRGSVQITVAKGGVTPGTYTATAEGILVGTVGAGTGVTKNAKGDERPTTFWISLSAGKEK